MQKIGLISRLFLYTFSCLLFISCSTQKRLSKTAHSTLIDKPELATAHVGVAVYDPSKNKYLYNYQGDKYFIPASNTKLFTLYAGLKYLEDSLVAARVSVEDETVVVHATGDPTFLHPDFKNHPLLKFLQQRQISSIRLNAPFASTAFAPGWSWDDYLSKDMAERDPFPIYGNVATIFFEADTIRTIPPILRQFVIGMPVKGKGWEVTRELGGHIYTIDTTRGAWSTEKQVTMAMDKGLFASRYLADTLHKEVVRDYSSFPVQNSFPVYSQPKDSLFKMMMHRSDNFFAEQTLMMVSEEVLGEMNAEKMIDTLLKSELRDLPQKPRWVDGSGLSRYNLFSPKDFTWLLNKLDKEFGFERMKIILPGANEGTLKNYYKGYENRIYAKTGSLSNNLALSGYLVTKSNKQLIFSVMVNNHNVASATVRRDIEAFLTSIINRY
jgi:D-alanyl-D-alanine carboxypeptidase/D-alanyl-D-alanine-endopeptidase (penicillin-binding protein 4)